MQKSIPEILGEAKIIAVVGLSDKPERFSLEEILQRVLHSWFIIHHSLILVFGCVQRGIGRMSAFDVDSYPESSREEGEERDQGFAEEREEGYQEKIDDRLVEEVDMVASFGSEG